MALQNIVSPVDGTIYASVQIVPDGDADELVFKARTAQRAWAEETLETRLDLCRAFLRAMAAQGPRVATEIT